MVGFCFFQNLAKSVTEEIHQGKASYVKNIGLSGGGLFSVGFWVLFVFVAVVVLFWF